jgi:hypothetical protein
MSQAYITVKDEAEKLQRRSRSSMIGRLHEGKKNHFLKGCKMVPFESINSKNSWIPKSVFAFINKTEAANGNQTTCVYQIKIFEAKICLRSDTLDFVHIASFETPVMCSPDVASFPVDLTSCHTGIIEW